MQVRLHELEHQVQVTSVLRFYRPLQLHHVLVIQLVQDRHFPVSTLRVDVVLEGIENLFERVLAAASFVEHFPDVAVGAAAEEGFQLESGQNVALDFFAH